jgi:hypothetical protein
LQIIWTRARQVVYLKDEWESELQCQKERWEKNWKWVSGYNKLERQTSELLEK